MKRGILVFDHHQGEWRVWIGQQPYWIEQGYTFELRIKNRHFHAYLEKDFDWFVTLDQEVRFVLHTYEVYKIRLILQDYIRIDASL
ncbi:DUF5348 domain-containing protein [Anaerobacillus isosaccharinicus]|uniref:DUF5348 domain-containing protein n=1 Tax=Anaerobacillus isosaccharinicus TaxID=1532552 RepID=A0A1S2L525_9BACI|nr:DUF5348 domain-containing protein [Anaerobacillus isosaccharinicus]MBA5583973.1 DUF5348 domain-containing protein [Anaerobacillus isosaccharinicus]MBA5584701.1 DUF5348 domain-containing protein [Anaerobacillus isosaccharinicus]MBA5585239.1 DUF5348 domain-containing protein [Anaerobacillus isosaccharinicus]MBA5586304.1 DUF5348 domain-containing protein [Anaerobacillus isosaccharinicus]MBA5586341.1 DUF5348 domain-containing protein [Anaerobacillus isosaccharinicus]